LEEEPEDFDEKSMHAGNVSFADFSTGLVKGKLCRQQAERAADLDEHLGELRNSIKCESLLLIPAPHGYHEALYDLIPRRVAIDDMLVSDQAIAEWQDHIKAKTDWACSTKSPEGVCLATGKPVIIRLLLDSEFHKVGDSSWLSQICVPVIADYEEDADAEANFSQEGQTFLPPKGTVVGVLKCINKVVFGGFWSSRSHAVPFTPDDLRDAQAQAAYISKSCIACFAKIKRVRMPVDDAARMIQVRTKIWEQQRKTWASSKRKTPHESSYESLPGLQPAMWAVKAVLHAPSLAVGALESLAELPSQAASCLHVPSAHEAMNHLSRGADRSHSPAEELYTTRRRRKTTSTDTRTTSTDTRTTSARATQANGGVDNQMPGERLGADSSSRRRRMVSVRKVRSRAENSSAAPNGSAHEELNQMPFLVFETSPSGSVPGPSLSPTKSQTAQLSRFPSLDEQNEGKPDFSNEVKVVSSRKIDIAPTAS